MTTTNDEKVDEQTNAPRQDLRTRIARRAYEIYEREGQPNGRAVLHWLAAERELLAQLAPAAKFASIAKPAQPRDTTHGMKRKNHWEPIAYSPTGR